MNRRTFLLATTGGLIVATLPVVRPPAEPLLEVRHLSCGQVALRLRGTFEAYRDGMVLNAAVIVYDDGRRVVDDDGTGENGTILTCQACKQMLGQFIVDDHGRAVVTVHDFEAIEA